MFKRKNNENILELSAEEVINDLGFSINEINLAILSLEKDGYLKILKIPPSENLIEEIMNKLSGIDVLFLLGEISKEKYLKMYEQTLDIMTRIPENQKSFSPIPITSFDDFLENINNLIKSLEKLKKFNKEARREVLEDIQKKYNEMLREELNMLSRIIKSISITVKHEISIIEMETRQLEVLEFDERIREINLNEEKQIRRKKIDESKKKLSRLYKNFFLERDSVKNKTSREQIEIEKDKKNEIDVLEYKRDSLKMRINVLNAKILIEGEKLDYLTLKKELENQLRDIELKIEEIKFGKPCATFSLTSTIKNLEKSEEIIDLLSKENYDLILNIIKYYKEINETFLTKRFILDVEL
jgi:hypothetical protein